MFYKLGNVGSFNYPIISSGLGGCCSDTWVDYLVYIADDKSGYPMVMRHESRVISFTGQQVWVDTPTDSDDTFAVEKRTEVF